LRYKEKIVKNGLHCLIFLSIVRISGKKWVFVGIFAKSTSSKSGLA
jgi:hypothetical protein